MGLTLRGRGRAPSTWRSSLRVGGRVVDRTSLFSLATGRRRDSDSQMLSDASGPITPERKLRAERFRSCGAGPEAR